MRALIIGVFALSLVTPATSWGRAMTCGDLKARFEGRSEDRSFDPGAELLGVIATHPELCVPDGTMLGTLQAIFVHWTDDNPNLMQMPSWDCAAKAFHESFHCSPRK